MSGIELSQPMADRLHAKRADIPVVVGDMATSTVPGEFSLVYVVWNSIGNLRTQAEQVACFRNAARHLLPGGRFVVELGVPGIRRFPPGQAAVPFHVGRHHVGFDTYDLATQQGTSHHYRRTVDGTVTHAASNFRYIWPAECDLMAQLAELELESRAADWRAARPMSSPTTPGPSAGCSRWCRDALAKGWPVVVTGGVRQPRAALGGRAS